MHVGIWHPPFVPNASGSGGGPLGASSVTEVDAISVLGSAKLVLGNMRNKTPKNIKICLTTGK